MPNISSPSMLPIFFLSRTTIHQRLFLSFQSKPISTTPVPTHQHIAHLVLEQKSATQALQTFKWASKLPNFAHSQSTYRALIHKLCTFRRFDTVKEVLDEMQALVLLEKCFSNGFVPDIITVTKVIEILCNEGRVTEAVEVLERVENKGGTLDVVAYNALIKGFCKKGKVKLTLRYLKEMESKGCLPNIDTYNVLIGGLCESGMLDSALDMFHEMKTVGIRWNFVTYDTLIGGLCFGGRMEDGFKILELMEESKGGSGGHISPYNSIIYGLYKENRLIEALEFLTKMGKLFPRAVDRSLRILGFCEEGCVDDAKRVYHQIIGEGGIPSALVYASLIRGFCQQGFVKEAFELMNEMVGRSYFPVASTFNVLICGLCGNGKVGSSFKLMKDMVGRGCLPDIGSYSPLVDASCKKGDFQKALLLFLQMLDEGIIPDYFTWNALVLCLSQEQKWLEGESMFRTYNLLQRILET